MFDPTLYADKTITIAGLGNIGSHTALALARMGLCRFKLYDFDTIEAHNLSSQAYSMRDVGKGKVETIALAMRALNPSVQLELHNEPCTGAGANCDILISAVDNLDARRAMAAGISQDTFVVDGRMGGGQIEVHSQPASAWGSTIPSSADDDPCGARFISYTSYIIAGLIANNVKRHLRGERVAKRILLHVDTLQSIIENTV
jgi:ketopantoate reductase